MVSDLSFAVYARRVGVYLTRMDPRCRPLKKSIHTPKLRPELPHPQILCMLMTIPDRYNKANASPILKVFLSRIDDVIARVSSNRPLAKP
jgi:hypothetical protein